MKKISKVFLPTVVIALSIILFSVQSSEVTISTKFKVMDDAEFAVIQTDSKNTFEKSNEDAIFGAAHFKLTENGAFG
ncbi:hypothetical protein P9D51_00030 [Bacillus sonorensis]|uniref:hypothetical protein n=1 Tax=Bacillus TaxID=1386 RepID=UPI0004971234|nr:hypothetical protein [Bacillus sonorensis]MBG9917299.1 hypothetical protein [Bacillus sonorensis]MCF7620131.1 hypothetical protein [Bacillus sonorensis]MCY8027187.1 hypothetical protein [Bacillus sonorensis]MCY8034434.1 hypothetical protein [Bacillus sonorensis]MCY8090332.1 hypothetical protein [Bacillus sonorensis]